AAAALRGARGCRESYPSLLICRVNPRNAYFDGRAAVMPFVPRAGSLRSAAARPHAGLPSSEAPRERARSALLAPLRDLQELRALPDRRPRAGGAHLLRGGYLHHGLSEAPPSR